MFIAYKRYSKDKENCLCSSTWHSALNQGLSSSLNNWIRSSIRAICNNILEHDSTSWKFKPAADWAAFNSLTNKLENQDHVW
jgi:hypothetical protein